MKRKKTGYRQVLTHNGNKLGYTRDIEEQAPRDPRLYQHLVIEKGRTERTGDRGQKTADSGQWKEDRGQGDRGQGTGDRGQRTGDR